MNLKEYVKKFNNNTFIEENPQLGTQCVALVKHYSNIVLGVRLGSFGGSAYSGWLNERNTFKKSIWRKVKNDLSNPNQVPPAGSIGFMKPSKANGGFGHTFVIINAKKGSNYFEVFEQNVGNGNGEGYDDRTKKGKYRYNKNFLGWYEKINNNLSAEKVLESGNEFLKSINKEQAKKIKILEKENLILKSENKKNLEKITKARNILV